MTNEKNKYHTVASLNDAINEHLRTEPFTQTELEALAESMAGNQNRCFGWEKDNRRRLAEARCACGQRLFIG